MIVYLLYLTFLSDVSSYRAISSPFPSCLGPKSKKVFLDIHLSSL